MNRTIVALALFAIASSAMAQEFSTGHVVDVSQGTEMRAGMFGGVSNANQNAITVDLDGMRYTAAYQTVLPGGKNSASQFVVGTDVQARIVRDNWLELLRPDGKPLRVRIVRREKL